MRSSPRPVNHLQPGLFGSVRAEMYCDGASSGNPGDAGIGAVIIYGAEGQGESVRHNISEYIGTATNNVAEYTALLRGLQNAGSLGIQEIDIYMDSELLVRQINGIYRVRNQNLLPLWTEAMKLLKGFSAFTVTHVPREKNKEADSLARKAVKQKKRG